MGDWKRGGQTSQGASSMSSLVGYSGPDSAVNADLNVSPFCLKHPNGSHCSGARGLQDYAQSPDLTPKCTSFSVTFQSPTLFTQLTPHPSFRSQLPSSFLKN